MEVLVINGHDYSRFIEHKGVNWSRNDLDSDKTGRTKSGVMRRTKIGTKRKLSYALMNMTQTELAQLDTDLSQSTFTAKYLDLHGVMTKKFYCSSFNATLSDCADGGTVWDGASFTMTEV